MLVFEERGKSENTAKIALEQGENQKQPQLMYCMMSGLGLVDRTVAKAPECYLRWNIEGTSCKLNSHIMPSLGLKDRTLR